MLKAAPVLKIGLVLLKVGMMSVGIPLPIAGVMEMLGNSAESANAYMDAALQQMQSAVSDGATTALDDLTAADNVEQYLQSIDRSSEGTRAAYEAIKDILKGFPNAAGTCGLVQKTTAQGKVQWVLEDKAVLDLFDANGGAPLSFGAASPAQVIAGLKAKYSSVPGTMANVATGMPPQPSAQPKNLQPKKSSMFSMLGSSHHP